MLQQLVVLILVELILVRLIVVIIVVTHSGATHCYAVLPAPTLQVVAGCTMHPAGAYTTLQVVTHHTSV